MSNRRFEMHQYRHIIFRLRLGETIRSIARDGLAARKTVKKILKVAEREGWLDAECELPKDELLIKHFERLPGSPITQSSVLPYQEKIEAWYQQGIQASTIYAALQRTYGFTGCYDAVQRFVKKIKTQSLEVTTILDFNPGECAQVDFGAGPKLLHEATGEVISTWVFIMVLAWSRHMYAEIVLRQDIETWLGCHRRAFEWFGGVPKKMIIDNAKCAITKACYYDPIAQRAYADYAQGYGFIISACPPRDQKEGACRSGCKICKK